jgi:hydroxymethylbilane synthase
MGPIVLGGVCDIGNRFYVARMSSAMAQAPRGVAGPEAGPGAPAPHPHAPKQGAPHKGTRPLPLRVGTRASPLALWQTRHFLSLISKFCPVMRGVKAFEEHAIRTTGDRVQDRRLADIGGKGLFAKEIHEALADGRVDFAVHSLKDLETELPPGIVLACTLKREDARDALILANGWQARPGTPFGHIPDGALVGTSSLRRQAQLLHSRPDLKVTLLRGNVQRRLERVAAGDVQASLLALAGLKRLELAHAASHVLSPDEMVPAAGQGIVGITVRADDTDLLELLSGIECREAFQVSTAERALLAALDGSCRTPIGGHATLLPEGQLRLVGLIARPDGSFLLRREVTGPAADAARIGAELGAELRAESPADIFG